MTTCPTCGAQNDPGNRFCDQCGTRLDAAPAAPASPGAVTPDQPTMAAPVCPNCGATILPGEAFCDNCGADLTAIPAAPAAPVSADAPTMLASAPPAAPAAPAADGSVACPVCGQANLPGEKFCDNCGADLSAPAPAAAPAPEAAPAPAASPDDATMLAPPPLVEPTPPPLVEPTPPPLVEPTPAKPAPPVMPDDATMLADALATPPPAESPPAAPAAPVAPSDAPTPAAGLADQSARKAELEAEMGRQQQIIAQFEQMQSMFGAATPPAVTAGLDEARAALARAEADLAALTGGAPITTPAPAAPVAAPAPPAAPAPAPDPLATIPAPPAAPAATPAPGPRLVVAEGGKELSLPADRAEIIVGREDPVSNIFPEIDLTSFGGETGGVSRQHAKITNSGGQWMITDLNSTNFTRVDGARLEPNVATPLTDGARVQFGRVVTTFRL